MLPGAVIPAKAGIYFASHRKCAAGLDSRLRGNDQCFESRRSADLFRKSAARPLWARKSRGPTEQVRATLPRPEFLPTMGSRKAVKAQDLQHLLLRSY
jgi:hypothetical protein